MPLPNKSAWLLKKGKFGANYSGANFESVLDSNCWLHLCCCLLYKMQCISIWSKASGFEEDSLTRRSHSCSRNTILHSPSFVPLLIAWEPINPIKSVPETAKALRRFTDYVRRSHSSEEKKQHSFTATSNWRRRAEGSKVPSRDSQSTRTISTAVFWINTYNI